MRHEKEYLVNEIVDKIKDSDSLFLTSYLGLNAESITELRKECYKGASQYLVVKNRILKIALEKAGLEVNDEVENVLLKSTAVAFSKEDAVAVAKSLIKFGKDNGLPEMKGGYIEGKWFDDKQVEAFSKLPSREVLLAQLMGALKAPLNGFVSVLSAPMRNFACALKAVGEQKQS